ncbi:MAG: hypothetical protein GXP55_13105 [Deltaproteobacteria bacterium]|nr:hypothetical protein [Deltaproteobacteria bacterium]
MHRHVQLGTLALLLSSGCGFTVGVDVQERATELDAPADGIARFEMNDVSVDDEVVVQGTGSRIALHLEMLDWSARPDSIRAEIANRGDVARLQMVGSESMSLVRVDASIPSTLGADIELAHGGVEIRDLSAPVFVHARTIALRDIAAPVVAEGGEVRLRYIVPIDLTSVESVTGFVGAGGVINTEADAQITLTSSRISDLEVHSLSESEGSFVEILLPPGGGFTVLLRTPGHALFDYEEVNYDSVVEGAPSAAAGLTFDVGGGGPLITATARAGSVLIRSTESSITP